MNLIYSITRPHRRCLTMYGLDMFYIKVQIVYIKALRPEFELKHYYNFLIHCLYIVMFFTPCHIGKQQKTN